MFVFYGVVGWVVMLLDRFFISRGWFPAAAKCLGRDASALTSVAVQLPILRKSLSYMYINVYKRILPLS